MPRSARIKSQSNIYHVMLRAVNKQQIFYDDEDYLQFIGLLRHYKDKCGYKLYAYCLMGNHVHLLIAEEDEPLEIIFRRIGSAFVYWYNTKYERVGHLFQDRFKSEPVNDDQYFLTVLRYILHNPVNAGYCASPADYQYSSACEYLLSLPGITDTDFVEQIMSPSMLKIFLLQDHSATCMDISTSEHTRCTDTRAKELIISEFGTYYPEVKKKKDRQPMDEAIRRLISKGISIRQLSRLSGIPKKIIETALNS